MEYKIGDVSKFLNISDQMIRYYEKHGVIKPKRKGDGNYRYYDAMDIFWLYEAMKYKEWDINIADVKNIISDGYFDKLGVKLRDFSKQLKERIKNEELLLGRIIEIEKRLAVGQYNIENFWVEQVPSMYRFNSNIGSTGDNYTFEEKDFPMKSYIFTKDYISFFDVLVEFNDNNENWSYAIDKYTLDQLEIEIAEKIELLPDQLCVCTIIDMGEFGDFNSDCLNNLMNYLKERDHQLVSKIFGIIVGRGSVAGKLNRIMKIYAPIKTL